MISASRKLFALDQNFPEPIVVALNDYIVEAELVSIREIDPLMPHLDDWKLIVALKQHERDWDGLITTNDGMLKQPREVSAVRQTDLTLVVAHDAGHDPIKATGLLFLHLGWICRESHQDRPQIWDLTSKNRPGKDPVEFLEKIAMHRNLTFEDVEKLGRLSKEELTRDALG